MPTHTLCLHAVIIGCTYFQTSLTIRHSNMDYMSGENMLHQPTALTKSIMANTVAIVKVLPYKLSATEGVILISDHQPWKG